MSLYDSLDDLNINTVINENDYKDFKFHSIDDRLNMLNNYLKNIKIDENEKENLIKMVKDEKLKNKNDINFDKVNKSIINISILEYNNNSDFYCIKKKKQNNNNDNNKFIINKLIKC